MRYEEGQGVKLPKIGFGTWKIGGTSTADRRSDARSLDALRSAIELGYTHFDTAEMYASGHCEELLGRALAKCRLPREAFFITSKVLPDHLDYAGVIRACEASLRRLGLDYLDLYLIHWPNPRVRLQDTFQALNRLAREGKVLHLGVSNFNRKLLESAELLTEYPILTDQVPYGVHNREYARNGVLDYCRVRGILITAYSPLDAGSFLPDTTLTSIASNHGVSPQQAALAWLCNQPGVVTIPMSRNPEHQRDNFEAADLVLTPAEIQQLG